MRPRLMTIHSTHPVRFYHRTRPCYLRERLNLFSSTCARRISSLIRSLSNPYGTRIKCLSCIRPGQRWVDGSITHCACIKPPCWLIYVYVRETDSHRKKKRERRRERGKGEREKEGREREKIIRQKAGSWHIRNWRARFDAHGFVVTTELYVYICPRYRFFFFSWNALYSITHCIQSRIVRVYAV